MVNTHVRHTMTRLLLLLLLLPATGAVRMCAQVRTADLSARIDSVALAALAEGPIAGLSVAVLKDGEVLHTQGYGLMNVATGTKATAETVYNIASVAKIVTAAAVLKLVDGGRLDLDDNLATLLPEFPNREQGGRITLHQLLNHTAGMNDYVVADVERWIQTREPLDAAFVIDYLRDRPLDFTPGSNWIYSNTGFYLAGLIVEAATGQAWSDFVLEVVVRPLGLASVALCDDFASVRSVGYDVTEDGFTPSPEDAEEGVRGDAGLCATALDLARLPSSLLNSALLSEAGLNDLLGPTRLTNGVSVDYGLGIALGSLDGHRLWGHLGGNASSYVATLAHFPDDHVSIAVLVNSRFGKVGSLVIEAEIARVVLDLGPATLKDDPLIPEEQTRYLGTYVGDRGGHEYRIVSDGEQIARVWASDSTSTRLLLHQGNHSFGRADWPMDRYVFHVIDGRALGYSAYYNGIFDGYYRRLDP